MWQRIIIHQGGIEKEVLTKEVSESEEEICMVVLVLCHGSDTGGLVM